MSAHKTFELETAHQKQFFTVPEVSIDIHDNASIRVPSVGIKAATIPERILHFRNGYYSYRENNNKAKFGKSENNVVSVGFVGLVLCIEVVPPKIVIEPFGDSWHEQIRRGFDQMNNSIVESQGLQEAITQEGWMKDFAEAKAGSTWFAAYGDSASLRHTPCLYMSSENRFIIPDVLVGAHPEESKNRTVQATTEMFTILRNVLPREQ